MKKKIFTMLVLLMTAVTGAVAQSYVAKVFDVPASWTGDQTPLSAADLPDFVQITSDEVAALAVPDGLVYLIFGFEGDKVILLSFNSGTLAGADTFQTTRSDLLGYQTDKNAIICYPAALATLTADGTVVTIEEMPAYDVTVDYELVRDMSVDVDADIAERIRIKNNGGVYELVDATLMVPVIVDVLDGATDTLTVTTDYTVTLQMKDGENWVDADNLELATYRFKVTGAGLYDGEIYTNEFRLFQGYEVEVEAGQYATFYKDENLKLDEDTENAELRTITSVEADQAQATVGGAIDVAPHHTPLLVHNTADVKQTILLIPTEEQADEVQFATEFKGTLDGITLPVATNTLTYYALNGTNFVWVKYQPLDVPANKCYLQIGTEPVDVKAINIVFDETTGIESLTPALSEGEWYDLNGRKIQTPKQRGIYINNGKKVVVK